MIELQTQLQNRVSKKWEAEWAAVIADPFFFHILYDKFKDGTILDRCLDRDG